MQIVISVLAVFIASPMTLVRKKEEDSRVNLENEKANETLATLVDVPERCTHYMAETGCGWTKDWNCPGQYGGPHRAGNDGSIGYSCCCESQLWRDQCHTYERTTGCGWTEVWNCPGQTGGMHKAGNDGSVGYKCCCESELWRKLKPEYAKDSDTCSSYMKESGCGWTEVWNCPGQTGGSNRAANDGSIGYGCCCESELWKEASANTPETKRSGNIVTVFHQTSPRVCQLILKGGFRIGKGGLCGKAAYFAETPEATRTKAITASSEGGCMIEAKVDAGRQGYFQADGRWSSRWSDGHKEQWCGPYSSMNEDHLRSLGYDTIVMRRGDGPEVIVFDPSRIFDIKVVPFKCEWMCQGRCQKHWPEKCHGHRSMLEEAEVEHRDAGPRSPRRRR